ncbi:MAG: hypothetical protein V3W51_05500 [Candidatus Brocadiales bacterium]
MRVYLILLVAASTLFPVSCTTPGDIASLQRRVERNPEGVRAHYDLAVAYLKRGIEWEGPRNIGIAIIASKRWTKRARNEFQKVIGLDPDFAEPHYWLKVIYNAQGRYEEADKESLIYIELVAREKERSSR